jgi:hypothetical protein
LHAQRAKARTSPIENRIDAISASFIHQRFIRLAQDVRQRDIDGTAEPVAT